MRIRVRVPASSANLGCGFDIFGLALNRYSTFVFDTDTASGPALQTAGVDAVQLQSEGCDLVYTAVRTYEEAFGVRLPAFRLEVESHIPIGRGLGSSAAAIVAGLLGAHALAQGVVSAAPREVAEWRWLLRLACRLEGHADNIAAALFGGIVLVVACGRGEDAPLAIRLPTPAELMAVLFLPELVLSTTSARSVLPGEVPLPDAVHNAARAALFVAVFSAPEERLHLLAEAMDDRLHQPYRAALMPHLPAFIAAAVDAGAYGAALSGAGPSILAFSSRERAEAVRETLSRTAERHGVAGQSEVLAIAGCGATIEGDA